PRTTTVSPGWMARTLVLTVLVIDDAAEVLTFTVAPSASLTYSVAPLTNATSPIVTDPPAAPRRPAKPPLPGRPVAAAPLAPPAAAPPRRADSRDASPDAGAAEPV